MFYVRHPKEKGQELIGQALATLWMVVHSVQGIMFKDLKQILRKEQVIIRSCSSFKFLDISTVI